MKHGIWIVVPLLVLSGVSACSGANSTTSQPAFTTEVSAAVPDLAAATTVSGLEGIEFVVHQAPG